MAINEADTCRKYVVPLLQQAGWDSEPHLINEQHTFTDGRIVVSGNRAGRRLGKRADYLLRYSRDFSIAVVEAKAAWKSPAAGLQQAKEYAEALCLQFAFATNGHGIVEYDFVEGTERELVAFPTPDELWSRYLQARGLSNDSGQSLLTPGFSLPDKTSRYYQETAVNRAVEAILGGRRRILLTLATGTGKTLIAFQVCWKLWSARWNRLGQYRRPRMLYLSDRNILIDDPKDRFFAPFGDARYRIENGEITKSRDMYFAIYQAIAKDERRPGLYRDFGPDFFDLIIVDECHRGSAREESNWREILEYFRPAFQLGMTATPKRDDNVDTYRYFGNPIYQYSLRQGIQDGFLAPYRVYRVLTSFDALGWRPGLGDLDRYGREIPDQEYHTPEFEREVALRARTEAIARHLTGFLGKSDRFAKTIVFCVDQEHADDMRRALNNLNTDLSAQYPDYVCRITSDEGDVGRGHLGRFKDIETRTPVIATTSQLLTTGVDVPTCHNIALAKVVSSMTEFKQMIGRGTRVREDYGKLYFNIIDYTGSATALFADPDFDGYPALVTEQVVDDEGAVVRSTEDEPEPVAPDQDDQPVPDPDTNGDRAPRKLYFDGGSVEIVAQLVYELDAEGKQLRVVRLTEYAAERVRDLCPTSDEMRRRWADPDLRQEVLSALSDLGIEQDALREATHQPDADPFDLLCHLAYNAPLRTRRDRAASFRRDGQDFFQRYGVEARLILGELLDKYAEHGPEQLVMPDALSLPPVSHHGNILEIAQAFGGADRLRDAMRELQALLYAA